MEISKEHLSCTHLGAVALLEKGLCLVPPPPKKNLVVFPLDKPKAIEQASTTILDEIYLQIVKPWGEISTSGRLRANISVTEFAVIEGSASDATETRTDPKGTCASMNPEDMTEGTPEEIANETEAAEAAEAAEREAAAVEEEFKQRQEAADAQQKRDFDALPEDSKVVVRIALVRERLRQERLDLVAKHHELRRPAIRAQCVFRASPVAGRESARLADHVAGQEPALSVPTRRIGDGSGRRVLKNTGLDIRRSILLSYRRITICGKTLRVVKSVGTSCTVAKRPHPGFVRAGRGNGAAPTIIPSRVGASVTRFD